MIPTSFTVSTIISDIGVYRSWAYISHINSNFSPEGNSLTPSFSLSMIFASSRIFFAFSGSYSEYRYPDFSSKYGESGAHAAPIGVIKSKANVLEIACLSIASDSALRKSTFLLIFLAASFSESKLKLIFIPGALENPIE